MRRSRRWRARRPARRSTSGRWSAPSRTVRARPSDVARAAAAAACDGELARYWLELLDARHPRPAPRATALEILTYCMRAGAGSPDAGRLAVADAQAGSRRRDRRSRDSARAGVVRVDCTRIVVDEDPVFREAVQALYRREFGRMTPSAVVAPLAAEQGARAPAAVRRRLRREALPRGAARRFCCAWAGQQVPADLFDAAASRAPRRGGAAALPRTAAPTSSRFRGRLRRFGTGRQRRVAPRPGAGRPRLGAARRVPGSGRRGRLGGRVAPGRRGQRRAARAFDREVAALQGRATCPRRAWCAGRSSMRRSTARASGRRQPAPLDLDAAAARGARGAARGRAAVRPPGPGRGAAGRWRWRW